MGLSEAGRALILVFTVVLTAAGCDESTSASRDHQARIDAMFEGIGGREVPPTPESRRKTRALVEEKRQQADEAAEAGDHDRSIELLEDALYLDYKNREAMLRIAESLHARSLALEETDPEQAGMDIRLAGVYLSRLKLDYQDFSEDELRLFAEVYFDEARVYGRTQWREAEFSEALANALEAGFDDVERLKTEPDFAQFRTNPQTAPLIESAIASLQSGDKTAPRTDAPDDSDPEPSVPDGR